MPVETAVEDRMHGARRLQIGRAGQHLVQLVGIFPAHMAKRDAGELLGQVRGHCLHGRLRSAPHFTMPPGLVLYLASSIWSLRITMRRTLSAAVIAALLCGAPAAWAQTRDAGPDSGMRAEQRAEAAPPLGVAAGEPGRG